MSFFLFNIYDFRPFFKKPVTLIVIVGEITSSSRYNSLKLGKAIAIKTNAGVIVQINSINVKTKLNYINYKKKIFFIFSFGLYLSMNFITFPCKVSEAFYFKFPANNSLKNFRIVTFYMIRT